MKIFITGGAGFIGAYTAAALVEEGHQVTVFDDFNDVVYPKQLKQARVEHFKLNQESVRLISGSILDQPALAAAFGDDHYDVLIHLAALANPGLSMRMPDKYFLINVEGTKSVLRAAHSVSRIIFSGSSSVYNDKNVPFREDSYPLRPRSPYGKSKAQAETVLKEWHGRTSIPLTILRFFSVYGPWGRPDMAPIIFARKILAGEPLEVTAEPRKRDFTYIGDILKGIVATVHTPFDFEIINLGRGEPMDLESLITALEQAAGKKAIIHHRDAPDGEMRQTYADISKARALLEFDPKTSLEEGAGKLVNWVKEYYLE